MIDIKSFRCKLVRHFMQKHLADIIPGMIQSKLPAETDFPLFR